MNNLADVFNKKKDVIKLTTSFGFSDNIHLFFGHCFDYETPTEENPEYPQLRTDISPLTLMIYVKEIENTSVVLGVKGWLSAKLSELFQSEVYVKIFDYIESYHHENIYKMSYLLTQEEDLRKALKVNSLTDIKLISLPEDFYNRSLYEISLENANEFLDKQVDVHERKPSNARLLNEFGHFQNSVEPETKKSKTMEKLESDNITPNVDSTSPSKESN